MKLKYVGIIVFIVTLILALILFFTTRKPNSDEKKSYNTSISTQTTYKPVATPAPSNKITPVNGDTVKIKEAPKMDTEFSVNCNIMAVECYLKDTYLFYICKASFELENTVFTVECEISREEFDILSLLKTATIHGKYLLKKDQVYFDIAYFD